MNEDTFAKHLARLITDYQESCFEKEEDDFNPYHEVTNKKNESSLERILENPIFDYSYDDIVAESSSGYKILYNNIRLLYYELKELAGANQ